jgi:hypothetical protein
MAGMFPTPIYPGIDVDANVGPYINSVCGVAIGLSFVTLSLRFFTRWWSQIEFGKDDYLILVGVVCLPTVKQLDSILIQEK